MQLPLRLPHATKPAAGSSQPTAATTTAAALACVAGRQLSSSSCSTMSHRGAACAAVSAMHGMPMPCTSAPTPLQREKAQSLSTHASRTPSSTLHQAALHRPNPAAMSALHPAPLSASHALHAAMHTSSQSAQLLGSFSTPSASTSPHLRGALVAAAATSRTGFQPSGRRGISGSGYTTGSAFAEYEKQPVKFEGCLVRTIYSNDSYKAMQVEVDSACWGKDFAAALRAGSEAAKERFGEEGGFKGGFMRDIGLKTLIANRKVTVHGRALLHVQEGQRFAFKGHWKLTKFGAQLEVEQLVPLKPESASEIIALLQGLGKGVGQKTAELIVECYGKKTLDVLDLPPKEAVRKLREIKGIGATKAKHIKELWDNNAARQGVSQCLQGLGLRVDSCQHVADHLAAKLGGVLTAASVEAELRRDPWDALMGARSVLFADAEKVALALGIAPADQHSRTKFALLQALKQTVVDINSACVPWFKLRAETIQLLASQARRRTSDDQALRESALELQRAGEIVLEHAPPTSSPTASNPAGATAVAVFNSPTSSSLAAGHSTAAAAAPGGLSSPPPPAIGWPDNTRCYVAALYRAEVELAAAVAERTYRALQMGVWQPLQHHGTAGPLGTSGAAGAAGQAGEAGAGGDLAIGVPTAEVEAGTAGAEGEADGAATDSEAEEVVAASGGLTARQLAAVELAQKAPLMLLTGSAGCGKTLTAREIVTRWVEAGKQVAVCAPTGRAAQRLQQLVSHPDVEAQTVHRLLGFRPSGGIADDTSSSSQAPSEGQGSDQGSGQGRGQGASRSPSSGAAAGKGAAQGGEGGAAAGGGGGGVDDGLSYDDLSQDMQELVQYNKERPLPADAVLLDEASMLDLQMASALLSALRPDAQLVLVGDPNQLAPVGPGHVLTALLSLRCRPPAAPAAAAAAAAPMGATAAAAEPAAAAAPAATAVSGAGAPVPGTALLEGAGNGAANALARADGAAGAGDSPASISAASSAAPAVAAAPAAAGVAAGGIVYAVRPTRRQRMVRGVLTRLPMRPPGSDVNGISSSDGSSSGGGGGSGASGGSGGGGLAAAAPPDSPLVPRMQLNEIFRQAKGGAIVSGALQITRAQQPSEMQAIPANRLLQLLDSLSLTSAVDDDEEGSLGRDASPQVAELATLLGSDAVLVEVDDWASRADLEGVVVQLVTKLEQLGVNTHEHMQVLSPVRRESMGTSACTVSSFNTLLQPVMNPPPQDKEANGASAPSSSAASANGGGSGGGGGGGRTSLGRFRLHDRVVQLKNNYEKEVYNGDVGTVVELEVKQGMLVVEYPPRPGSEDWYYVQYAVSDLHELQPAWCMTVHKSQGAEYPCVLVALHHEAGPLLHTRQLLYTAVTRARQLLLLVCTRSALQRCLANDEMQGGAHASILAGRIESALKAMYCSRPAVPAATSKATAGGGGSNGVAAVAGGAVGVACGAGGDAAAAAAEPCAGPDFEVVIRFGNASSSRGRRFPPNTFSPYPGAPTAVAASAAAADGSGAQARHGTAPSPPPRRHKLRMGPNRQMVSVREDWVLREDGTWGPATDATAATTAATAGEQQQGASRSAGATS